MYIHVCTCTHSHPVYIHAIYIVCTMYVYICVCMYVHVHVCIIILQGVLTMKNTHFEPRYILTLPLSAQVYMYMYIYTHTHTLSLSLTHTHTHSHTLTHTHTHTHTQVHAQRMRSSGQYSEEQVWQAVADVAFYQQMHRDRPGFFDTAINTGLLTFQLHKISIIYVLHNYYYYVLYTYVHKSSTMCIMVLYYPNATCVCTSLFRIPA